MMKLMRQIYAQASIRQLKEVHTRTHPATLTLDNAELAAELDEEQDELADEELAGKVKP